MSDVQFVHNVPADEIPAWATNLATTFLDDASSEGFQQWIAVLRALWPQRRTWGARADGRWVGTLATEPRNLTLPGVDGTTHDITIDALTNVTVNATHRRRGLLTRMLTESLREAAERGDPMSALIAAEWPIYGRFGYAPATFDARYTYHSRVAAVPPSPAGQVRQVSADELSTVVDDVFARARVRHAGQIDRPPLWWRRRLGLDGWRPAHNEKTPNYFLHETEGIADGVLLWTPERDFDIDGNLGAITVKELIAASDTAYQNLWAYLGGVDVIDEVRFFVRPVDEPARWLLPDGRALRQTYAGDAMWLRLLDVPASLEARGYRTDGTVIIDVVDDEGGFATGRYRLEISGGRAACERTTENADVRLTQRALASAYLGGFSVRRLAMGGGVDELRDGAIRTLDLLMGTDIPPWNATGF